MSARTKGEPDGKKRALGELTALRALRARHYTPWRKGSLLKASGPTASCRTSANGGSGPAPGATARPGWSKRQILKLLRFEYLLTNEQEHLETGVREGVLERLYL